jgi:serine/threonine-protein kinase
VALQPGDKLGPYEILAEIGRGGMATVYRAHQPSMGRPVAIKVLPEQFLHDPTFLSRFTNEARVIAALEHPRILPVYDFGEAAGVPYIVMRLMPHGSLRDRLRRGPLSIAEAVRVIGQVAEALDYAHARRVIHRDLKPDNVLMDEAGNCYLSDFGIAKVVESSPVVSGTVGAGTPKYMAPEQIRGGRPTPRSDIYALGAMAFELLSGRPPFEAEDTPALMYMHVYEPVPRLAEVRPDLPAAVASLQNVIDRAMAKAPEARYTTAGEFSASLARAAALLAQPSWLSDSPTPPAGFGPASPYPPAWPAAEPDPSLAPAPASQSGRALRLGALALGGVVLCGLVVLVGALGLRSALRARTSASALTATAGLSPAPGAGGPATATAPFPNEGLLTASAIAPEPTATAPATATASFTPSQTPPATGPPLIVPNTPLSGRIVFTCFDGSDDEVCLIGADGSGLAQLTDNAVADWYPSLSHDGRYIVFARQISGSNHEIFRMRPDGSELVQLTANGRQNYAPAYSPDDSRIAFTSTQGNGSQQIWVMDSHGGSAAQLTDDGGNVDPSWSPDGRYLAFASTRSGSQQIWIMQSDGSDQAQVTDLEDVGGRNSWSADGQSLAFYAGPRASGGRNVYVIAVDGTGLRQLTEFGDNLAPSFSPDGGWIAFASYRDGDNEIYVMRPDGSNVANVTRNSGSDYQPRWGP